MQQFPFANSVQTKNASTEKLLERLSYNKAARNMLVKLTPDNVFDFDARYTSDTFSNNSCLGEYFVWAFREILP